jgi:hypothetical protein
MGHRLGRGQRIALSSNPDQVLRGIKIMLLAKDPARLWDLRAYLHQASK